MSHTKTFDLKQRLARLIKRYDWPMVMNCVLHRHNLPHVGKIIEMALSLEAEFLELANTILRLGLDRPRPPDADSGATARSRGCG